MQHPPDRRLAAIVLKRQLRHGLAIGVALSNLLSLAVVEHRSAAKLRALLEDYDALADTYQRVMKNLDTPQ